MNDFQFTKACEEYEAGLTVMLEAARSLLQIYFQFSPPHLLQKLFRRDRPIQSQNFAQCGTTFIEHFIFNLSILFFLFRYHII